MVKPSNNFFVCLKCDFAYAENETIPNDNEANKLVKQKAHKMITSKHHDV